MRVTKVRVRLRPGVRVRTEETRAGHEDEVPHLVAIARTSVHLEKEGPRLAPLKAAAAAAATAVVRAGATATAAAEEDATPNVAHVVPGLIRLMTIRPRKKLK
jgi:hypothetical protein